MKVTFRSHALKVLSTAAVIGSIVFIHKAIALGDVSPFQGTKMAGMAGVGAAIPLDATSGNMNPALMANVGNIISIHPGAVFETHKTDYAIDKLPAALGGADIRGRGPQKDIYGTLPLLYGGFNYVINNHWSIGSSLTEIASITKYDNNVIIPKSALTPAVLANIRGSGPGNTYVRALVPELNNTIAYKPNDRQAYAVALVLAYEYFKSDLRTDNGVGPVTKGANQADGSFGAGLRLGGHWKLSSSVDLGLAVGTPVLFQKLKKYSDLSPFAPDQAWTGVIGLAWKVTPKTTLGFDIEGSLVSRIKYYGKNPPEGGLGLDDAINYKVGVQHCFTPSLAGRLGYNYGKTPIRDNSVYYNAFIESVGISEHMVGAGFTYSVNKKFDFDLSVNHFFKKTLTDNGILSYRNATKGMKMSGEATTVMLGFNYKY